MNNYKTKEGKMENYNEQPLSVDKDELAEDISGLLNKFISKFSDSELQHLKKDMVNDLRLRSTEDREMLISKNVRSNGHDMVQLENSVKLCKDLFSPSDSLFEEHGYLYALAFSHRIIINLLTLFIYKKLQHIYIDCDKHELKEAIKDYLLSNYSLDDCKCYIEQDEFLWTYFAGVDEEKITLRAVELLGFDKANKKKFDDNK